jgi:hypothetical protein
MSEKRKRQTIPLGIKKHIIDAKEADPSKSYAKLAKDFSKDGLTLTNLLFELFYCLMHAPI